MTARAEDRKSVAKGGSIPPQGTIKFLKGETIMKSIVDYNLIALTQVIVSAFTFRFFPSGK